MASGDINNDGDLDMYLVNYTIFGAQISGADINRKRNEKDALTGDKLYRNDGGKFTDVTDEARIKSTAIGFGLGVSIADFNKDGYQDIYVTNDFLRKITSIPIMEMVLFEMI